MKVAVTGGTGFVGKNVVRELLRRGIEVTVTGTDSAKAKKIEWFDKVNFLELDISNVEAHGIESIASSDKLIHLAWSGLPNYKELFHFEEQVLQQYFFLKKLVSMGLKDITVTGTCLEYGLKNGPLDVSMPTDPQNPYALAKDSLRKYLHQLQQKDLFTLKWIRLFYMYGPGQSKSSILSQLQIALNNGDEYFNMSGGEQLRDYLPVEDVANQIVTCTLNNDNNGIFNCCSGQPTSVLKLVENFLSQNNQTIKLNLGHYPYPDYEPMAFWGVKNIL